MGRALYRESGPSQDGDPDTGNLPFFFFNFFVFFYLFNLFFFSRFVSFLILYLAFKQSTYNGDLLSQISWESGACQFSFSFHLFILLFFFLAVYLLFSFDISLIVYVECRYNLIYIFFGVQFLEIHR